MEKSNSDKYPYCCITINDLHKLKDSKVSCYPIPDDCPLETYKEVCKGIQLVECKAHNYKGVNSCAICDCYKIMAENNLKRKFKEFIEKQKDLDPEFVNIVNENFWELLEGK